MSGKDKTSDFFDHCLLLRSQGHGSSEDRSNSMPNCTKIAMFGNAAAEVFSGIVKMRVFLNSQKNQYILKMSDKEADDLDGRVRSFSSSHAQSFQQFRSMLSEVPNKDIFAHRKAVVMYLEHEVNDVMKTFQLFIAARADQLQKSATRRIPTKFKKIEQIDELQIQSTSIKSGSRCRAATMGIVKRDVSDDGGEFFESSQDALSASQTQELEKENAGLLKKYETAVDQARSVERKLFEISQAVTLFADKVLLQEEQISHIYDAAIDSVAHIKQGTEELNNALQHSVSFRVGILFFLAMASVSLLFLDWYSN
jgi:hypothetical protein